MFRLQLILILQYEVTEKAQVLLIHKIIMDYILTMRIIVERYIIQIQHETQNMEYHNLSNQHVIDVIFFYLTGYFLVYFLL